jgi:phosphoglycolate phosphatase
MTVRPFELLVFDWDGTLMDSVATIVDCTREAFVGAGVAPPPEEAVRDAIGLGLRESFDRFAPGGGEELMARVLTCYRERWLAEYRGRQVLFPGIVDLLSGLAADGYLLAVATGKSRRGLDDALRSHGIEGLFQATRTADEAPSKPHPQMVLDILDELGVRPGAALVVGDSVHDLEMARAAGVASVGVCSGSHPRPELLRRSPLACLAGVHELPGWLAARAAGSG